MRREKTLSIAHIASWNAIANEIDDAMVHSLSIAPSASSTDSTASAFAFNKSDDVTDRDRCASPQSKTEAARKGVSGDDPFVYAPFANLRLERGSEVISTSSGNTMPIRVHVSQLSDEELLAKLGVKRRAKPREL